MEAMFTQAGAESCKLKKVAKREAGKIVHNFVTQAKIKES